MFVREVILSFDKHQPFGYNFKPHSGFVFLSTEEVVVNGEQAV